MKELEKENQDKLEIKASQKKESKKVLVKSIQPHENHICFEYNTKTNELSRAKYKKQDVTIWKSPDGKGIVHSDITRQVLINHNCEYITALNEKNAIKHFNNVLGYKIKPIII